VTSVNPNIKLTTNEIVPGKSLSQKLVKLKFGLVFRRNEKKKCTWLKLLAAELSVLHGLFGKRKEQYGTRNFLKARVEKKANEHPWL